MVFIFGGKYQGKTAHAISQYGKGIKVCDLSREPIINMYNADLIKNVQDGVRKLLREDKSPLKYFTENIGRLEEKIFIGTEIGCGIVPLAEEERAWRDETGRVYQFLAGRAARVERVWAGIALRLKG